MLSCIGFISVVIFWPCAEVLRELHGFGQHTAQDRVPQWTICPTSVISHGRTHVVSAKLSDPPPQKKISLLTTFYNKNFLKYPSFYFFCLLEGAHEIQLDNRQDSYCSVLKASSPITDNTPA